MADLKARKEEWLRRQEDDSFPEDDEGITWERDAAKLIRLYDAEREALIRWDIHRLSEDGGIHLAKAADAATSALNAAWAEILGVENGK